MLYIYIYIFHLTRLMPLHYLVKGGCSKFLPNSGFDGSDLVSKFRGHTIVTTFLLRGHCQTCTGCRRLFVFIACPHTDARYWYSNSVRLSVTFRY